MPWYLPTRCPILWDELRRRVRGGRHFALLFGFGMVLIAVTAFAAVISKYDTIKPEDWADFGRNLWYALLTVQLIGVLLISPGLTAAAVSAERERGSLDLLFLTPMSSLMLTIGKYVGAIGQLMIVILAGLPVISVAFFFGGVSPEEIVYGYLLLIISGCLYSALGLLASCVCKRLTSAFVWAYGFMAIILVGIPLCFLSLLVLNSFHSSDFASVTLWAAFANPIPVLINLLSDSSQGQTVESLAIMTGETLFLLLLCALRISHQRGDRNLITQTVSLEVARFNSRPRAAKKVDPDTSQMQE